MKMDVIKIPVELNVPEDVAEACCKILEIYLQNRMDLVIQLEEYNRVDHIERKVRLVKRSE